MALKGRLIVEACEEQQWRRLYGPVVRFFVGQRPCLLITTVAASRELFNDPATEGRPIIPFYAEQLGAFETITPMMPASGPQKLHVDALRRATLVSHRALSKNIGMRSSRAALEFLLQGDRCKSPIDLDYLVGGLARMNFFNVAYQERLETIESAMGDEFISELIKQFVNVTAFLNTSHELSVPFPFLEWLLPSRSNRLRAHANKLRIDWDQSSQALSNHVLAKYPQATVENKWEGLPNSIFRECLLNSNLPLDVALRASSGIALASMDTTSSTLKSVIAAFAYFRDMQREHQQHIDTMMEHLDRLPETLEETFYPKLVAFVREAMRICPAIPIGILRETTEEMQWMGKNIPAGTLLFPMVQLINRDPDFYGSDANFFRPDRFLDEKRESLKYGTLNSQAGFGFGKRSCPGADLAEKAICTTVCRLLYCFDITFEDETLPLRQTLMEALNPARDAQVRQVRPAAICFTPRKDRQLLGEQIQMSCDE
ncbi:unnamed protein product [Jaminaea pallidilutea]